MLNFLIYFTLFKFNFQETILLNLTILKFHCFLHSFLSNPPINIDPYYYAPLIIFLYFNFSTSIHVLIFLFSSIFSFHSPIFIFFLFGTLLSKDWNIYCPFIHSFLVVHVSLMHKNYIYLVVIFRAWATLIWSQLHVYTCPVHTSWQYCILSCFQASIFLCGNQWYFSCYSSMFL